MMIRPPEAKRIPKVTFVKQHEVPRKLPQLLIWYYGTGEMLWVIFVHKKLDYKERLYKWQILSKWRHLSVDVGVKRLHSFRFATITTHN